MSEADAPPSSPPYGATSADSLTARGIRAALWNYSGNVTRLLLQFGIGILLSRLLGPQGFGLVAVALLLIGIGQLFVDFGFNAAIVQAREIRQADIDFLFTVQLLVGAAMTGIGIAGSEPIAAFFHQPAAAPIIRWMSLMFVLRAVGQTAVALLNRDLRFRSIQTGSIAAYLIGYVGVGVPMAFAGMGAWSVVAAQLVQTAMSTILAIVLLGRVQRPSLRGGRRDLLKFGRYVVSANIGSWTLLNVDSLVVGHVLGSTTLGLYNRAMTLANAPTGAVTSSAQAVLFAGASRAQDNPDGCRRALYACIALVVLLAGPVLLAIAATAHTVTLALYGRAWLGAVPLLAPLSLAMVLNGVLGVFGPVLMGIGRIERETMAQWQAAVVMVPTVYLMAHISAAAVAWSIIPLYAVRLLLLARALHGVLPLDRRDLARAVLPALAVAAVTGAAAALADRTAAGLALPAGMLLLVDIAAAGLGLLFSAVALRRLLLTGPLGLLLPRLLPTRSRAGSRPGRDRS